MHRVFKVYITFSIVFSFISFSGFSQIKILIIFNNRIFPMKYHLICFIYLKTMMVNSQSTDFKYDKLLICVLFSHTIFKKSKQANHRSQIFHFRLLNLFKHELCFHMKYLNKTENIF